MKTSHNIAFGILLAFCSLSATATENSNTKASVEAQQTVLDESNLINSNQDSSCASSMNLGLPLNLNSRNQQPQVSVHVSVYSFDSDKNNLSLNLQNMYQKSSGDKDFANELSSYGKVRLLTSATLVTLNKQSVPFNITSESDDLAERTPVLSQAKQDSRKNSDSFAGVFTPIILDGNNLMLTSCLNHTVTKHNDFDGLILPNTSIAKQVNRIKVKSGETYVSTWYQVDSSERNQIVVLTTPTIE